MFFDPVISHDLWHVEVPVLEKIIRPILVYAFLVIVLRIAGKRELAQMNTFDLVVLLTLSNTVQNAIIGQDNSLSGGVIGAVTLIGVNALVVRLMYRHPRLNLLLQGHPSVLMKHGEILEKAIDRETITHEELRAAALKQGFDSLDEVEKATLEPGGVITFIGKKPDQETRNHHELLGRLDALTLELKSLQAQLADR